MYKLNWPPMLPVPDNCQSCINWTDPRCYQCLLTPWNRLFDIGTVYKLNWPPMLPVPFNSFDTDCLTLVLSINWTDLHTSVYNSVVPNIWQRHYIKLNWAPTVTIDIKWKQPCGSYSIKNLECALKTSRTKFVFKILTKRLNH